LVYCSTSREQYISCIHEENKYTDNEPYRRKLRLLRTWRCDWVWTDVEWLQEGTGEIIDI